VAVKIRLKRLGKIRAPYYRIVVADSRTKRDGRVIEEIGKYHPTEEPSLMEVDSARAQYWLGVGAQPSEQVLVILKVTGDWQKFKGLPGTEGTLRFAAPKVDKRAVFEAAAKESMGERKDGATTAKAKRPAKKVAAAAAAPVEAAAVEVAAPAPVEAAAVAVPAPVEAAAEVAATEAPAVVEAPAEAVAPVEAAPVAEVAAESSVQTEAAVQAAPAED
jgi:small subunit ribosomal protein S16